MNKTGFINKLAAETGLTLDQAKMVNEVIESNPFIGKNSREKIIPQIGAKLGIDEKQSKDICDKAFDIIGGALFDKIKNPFG